MIHSRFAANLRTVHATILAGVILVSPLPAKRKDDIVVMRNGDKMTGELKRLENGILYFKADYMVDAVQLDWERVEALETRDSYTIFLTTGKRATGTIEVAGNRPAGGGFAVTSGSEVFRAPRGEVVGIHPVEDTFWHQLTGSVDYGFDFTGGTNTTQSTLSADLAYRTENWAVQIDGSSVFNRQNGARNSGRNTLDFFYLRYLNDRWFLGLTSDLLNSQQQDLTLRLTAGGGIGRDLVRLRTASVQLLGGVIYSTEKYAASTGYESYIRDAEAQFRLLYSKYVFKTTQFVGTVYAFPNLTTPGRVRFGTQTDLSHEIFRNFDRKLSLYENYDTGPS